MTKLDDGSHDYGSVQEVEARFNKAFAQRDQIFFDMQKELNAALAMIRSLQAKVESLTKNGS